MKPFDPVAEARELERRHGAERAALGLQLRLHALERVRALEKRLSRSKGPRCHLVIGDSHANPEVGRDHYTWLGRMVADLRPEVVVDIGDWFDMDSLNQYDRGKRCFEGRRYWRDIEAGVEAQDRFRLALGGYAPELVRTLGNHEQRICRVAEYEPAFGDLIGLKDLQSREYGWTEVPFLEPVVIDGVTYVHYYEQPGSRRAISGVVTTRSVLLKKHVSTVFGHSHRLGYYEESDAHGGRICVLNAGCFFPQHAAYAGADNAAWRRGISVLRGVEAGVFDLEWWSWDRIRTRYGAK